MIIEKLVDQARLVVPTESHESLPEADLVNLSRAGAGILMRTPVKKGTRVKLQLTGKNISTVDFDAEVRWAASSPVSTGKYPLGLKFIHLDEQRLSKLHDVIELMRQHRPPPEQLSDDL